LSAVFWPQLRSDVTGVLSHQSALLLHDLSDVNPPQVHITLPKAFILRREPPKWLAVHRAEFDPNDVELINGLPTTTLRRTLCDLHAIGANAIVASAIADARAKGLPIPTGFE
jgi:predicted transcriptional regulator of viral defense system